MNQYAGRMGECLVDHRYLLAHYTHVTETGKREDNRPIVHDREGKGTSAVVLRILYKAEDFDSKYNSKKNSWRVEVQIIKPGKKSHHKAGDVVIWSIPEIDLPGYHILNGIIRSAVEASGEKTTGQSA